MLLPPVSTRTDTLVPDTQNIRSHQTSLVDLAGKDQVYAFARRRAARKRLECARAETRPIEKFEQQQHSHRARGWRLAGRLLARLLETPFDLAVRQGARQGPPRRGARDVERRIVRPPAPIAQARSGERRVGRRGVSPGIIRWSP